MSMSVNFHSNNVTDTAFTAEVGSRNEHIWLSVKASGQEVHFFLTAEQAEALEEAASEYAAQLFLARMREMSA